MHEVMFRLNDYFFYQFIYAITDANPYLDIYNRLLVELDPFTNGAKEENHSSSSESSSSGISNDSPSHSEPKAPARKQSIKYESSISEASNEQSDPASSSSKSDKLFLDEDDEANVDIPDEEDYSF